MKKYRQNETSTSLSGGISRDMISSLKSAYSDNVCVLETCSTITQNSSVAKKTHTIDLEAATDFNDNASNIALSSTHNKSKL